MAVKLRLTRVGKKKQPHYRIVATDSRSPRDGRFIEILGHYNPRTEPSEIKVDNDKAVGWLRNGAQPSDRVRKILEISGAWEQFTGQTVTTQAPAAKSAAPATSATSDDTAPTADAEPTSSDTAASDTAAADGAE
ncbi:hypothetical protein BH24ACT6_BH24ACT6_04980 [soil metagenome]